MDWEPEDMPEAPEHQPETSYSVLRDDGAPPDARPAAAGGYVAPLLVLLTLIVCPAIAFYLNRGPAPEAMDAASDVFSAARAMVHVEAIAAEPHPLGSPQNRAVAAYLVEELSALGLEAEIQETTILVNRWPILRGATVRNVAARIPGTREGKALLLLAHYDTVPHAPGAADDSSGVATLLETIRALGPEPALRNDVIVLFTDGEEAGLLGARAFVAQHPWAEEVGLVLNFEGRGTGGAVLMYETSDNNAWLVQEATRASKDIIGTSLMADVYDMMPNDTDLTPFKEAGFPALNFAFIEGYMRYHSAHDKPEHLSQRTLQHMGAIALSLTRHFANIDLDRSSPGNAIYFNPVGRKLIRYSALWAIPSALLLLFVFWTVMELGRWRRHASLRGVLAGALIFLLLAVGLAAGAEFGTKELLKQQGALAYHMSGAYLVAYALIVLGLMLLVYGVVRAWVLPLNLALGAAFWWVAAAMVSAILMPGGSVVFVWPALACLLGLALLAASADYAKPSILRAGVLCLAAVPLLLVFPPMVRLLLVAMTLRLAPAIVVCMLLGFGLILPLLFILTRTRSWILPMAALASGAGIIGAVFYLGGYSTERPNRDFILYGVDMDHDEAFWATLDGELDEWTSQFFGAGVQEGSLRTFFPHHEAAAKRAPAAILELPAPTVAILSDGIAEGKRWLHLRIQSPRKAPLLSLYALDDTVVYAADVQGQGMTGGPQGKALDLSQDPAAAPAPQAFSEYTGAHNWQLHFYAVPPGGIDVWLLTDPARTATIRVVDHSIGLPDLPDFTVSPRPTDIIPWRRYPAPFSDATLVAKSFAL